MLTRGFLWGEQPMNHNSRILWQALEQGSGKETLEGILREAKGYFHFCYCNQEAENKGKN